MSQYDPALKYTLADCLPVAEIAAHPERLHQARRAIEADLAAYPGVLVWEGAIEGGHHVITATRYPPEYAARAIERRRRPPRDEDAA